MTQEIAYVEQTSARGFQARWVPKLTGWSLFHENSAEHVGEPTDTRSPTPKPQHHHW